MKDYNERYEEFCKGLDEVSEKVDEIKQNERYEAFCKGLDEVSKKVDEIKRQASQDIATRNLIISELENYQCGLEDFLRGRLSEKQKEELIDWWTRMGVILDDPDAKKLSEINIAEKREEESIIKLYENVDKMDFEINRQHRIDKDHEARRERVARLQLRHCKELEDYDIDEFIKENGQSVALENRFNSPYGLVKFIEKNAPKMYEEMMNSYNQSMADKQAQLIESGHSFSDKSIKKFVK